MPSLLSFVWRRRQPSPQNPPPVEPATTITGNALADVVEKNFAIHPVSIKNTDRNKSDHTVPIMTSSSISSEEDGTTTLSPNSNQIQQQKVLLQKEKVNAVTTTPDGLKPRRSITDIRNDLDRLRRDHHEKKQNRIIQYNDGTTDSRSHIQNNNYEPVSSSSDTISERNRRVERPSTSNSSNSASKSLLSAPTTNSTTRIPSKASEVVPRTDSDCRAMVQLAQQQGDNRYDSGIQNVVERYRTNDNDYIHNGADNVQWLRMHQNHSNLVVDSTNASNSLAVLPPIPIRSWSTQETTTPVGSMLSSNGRVSFATGSSFGTSSATIDNNITPSAESPHLEFGRTRTAVGNVIVAMEHHHQQQMIMLDPPGMTPMQDISHRYNASHDVSISHNNWVEHSPQQEHIVETVVSPLHIHHRSTIPQSIAKSTNRSTSTSIPPLPMISEQPQTTSQTRQINCYKHHHDNDSRNSKHQQRTTRDYPMTMAIPESAMKKQHPPMHQQRQPPSMVNHHQSTGKNYDILPSIQSTRNTPLNQLPNSSFVEEKQHGGYSWSVTSSPSRSINSHSGNSSIASKKTITSTTNSIVVFDDEHHLISEQASERHDVPQQQRLNTSATYTDGSMQLRKIKSQNRVKEELIISALERLQDDLQLVSDVESLLQLGNNNNNNTTGNRTQRAVRNIPMVHGTKSSRTHQRQQQEEHSSMYDWFVSTPMNMEGLLTGFTDTNRYAILDKIDMLIHDFIDADEMGIIDSQQPLLLPHPSLREALVFCTLLVKMSIPESEKEDSSLQGTEEIGHWRFATGLREVIGLSSSADGGVLSVTPSRGREGGGGDASFFSLPEEDNNFNCDTPMTSNVSIGASTLTTIVKDPYRGENGILRPTFGTSIALNQLQQKQYNGLYLRQAIQLFTTGIHKMSMACQQLVELKGELLNPSSLLKSADVIQKSYLQLLSMNQNDLKSIVDAFEFEICATSYDDDNESICEVVDDTDDDDDPPELHHSKTVDSPILFAETLGFGTLNASATNLDDTTGSFDVTGSSIELPPLHYSTEDHNHIVPCTPSMQQQHPTSSLLQVHLPLHPPKNYHQQGLDETSISLQLQSNRKSSPVLTLESFFSQKQHIDTTTTTGHYDYNNTITNEDDDCNDSFASFAPSYKSIRLEI